MELSGLDLGPASAAYSWVTLDRYFPSHCLSFPIYKMGMVRYLPHGVTMRIQGVSVYYLKGFA